MYILIELLFIINSLIEYFLLSDEIRNTGEHYLLLNKNNNEFEIIKVRNGFQGLECDNEGRPKVVPNVHEDTCVICQEKFKDGKQILLASCGHHFHANCLDGWRKSRKSDDIQCPVCRAKIKAGYVVKFKKQADQNAQPNNELNNNQIEQNNEQNFNDQLNQIPVNEIENLANENGENENEHMNDEQNLLFGCLNVRNFDEFFRLGASNSVSDIAQEMLLGNSMFLDTELSRELPGETLDQMVRKNIYADGFCGLCKKPVDPDSTEKPAVITNCHDDNFGVFHFDCLKYEAAKSHTNLRETLKKPGTLIFGGRNLDALKNSLNELRELLGM